MLPRLNETWPQELWGQRVENVGCVDCFNSSRHRSFEAKRRPGGRAEATYEVLEDD